LNEVLPLFLPTNFLALVLGFFQIAAATEKKKTSGNPMMTLANQNLLYFRENGVQHTCMPEKLIMAVSILN